MPSDPAAIRPTGRPGAPWSSVGRAALGFAAGFLSVLTFQSAVLALLATAGVPVPIVPWSLAPVPPLGVPQSLSAAFWGGLWGIGYALLEPRLTGRLGWAGGGLVFGALPLLVLWLLVFPLKGIPVGGGFTLPGVLLGVALHASYGLGAAVFFRVARRFTR